MTLYSSCDTLLRQADRACCVLQVQNIMTAVIIILAMYYSVIALITTHLDVSTDKRNTIWYAMPHYFKLI